MTPSLSTKIITTASKYKTAFWVVLILLCWVIALWVPLYNRIEPQVLGIPFFYWFQVFMIIISASITALAYKIHL